MRFRAIATDLDGTLLRTDKSVSARTRRAVDAAEDAGLRFVIATGRPPRWIPPVVEQLGGRGLVVCANGASVYDPALDELIERTDLAAEVAQGIVADVADRFSDPAFLPLFAVEQGFQFGVDVRIEERAEDMAAMGSWQLPGIRIEPIDELLAEPVTKLIIRFPHPAPPGTAQAVQQLVGDRALVTHSITESFLELSEPTVHKAATVERLLLGDGIDPASVLAFGDMPNDLELLTWAGWGVAVANADARVQAAADEVTASNDDDGVARVIERVLDGR